MTPGRRSVVTYAAATANAVVGLLLGLAATPLLLRWLGPDRLGLYRAATEWVGYVALLDLGVGGAVVIVLAKAVGAGDRAEVTAAVAAGGRAYLRVAGLAALGVGALIAVAPLLARDLPADLTGELRWGLLFALLTQLWLPLGVFRPLAEARQDGFRVHLALFVQTLTTAGLAIALAAAGGGLAGQFAAGFAGVGVFHLLLTRYGLRAYPELARPAGWRAAGEPVRAFDRDVLMYHAAGRVSLLSDAIIVALLLGPAAVVAFTVTQRLLLAASGQVLAVGGAAWAALSALHHRGQRETFNRRLVELTRATGVLAFAAVGPVAVFNRPFVAAWVGEKYYAGDLLTAVTAVGMWLHGLVAVWLWPLSTAGHIRPAARLMLAVAAVNLAVSVGGTWALGPVGPALGTLAGFAGVGVWWAPRLLRAHFGTSPRRLAGAVAGPAAVAIPYLGGLLVLATAVADLWPMGRWAKLTTVTGCTALGAVGYLGLAWVAVLTKEDRAVWKARLRF
jgi:O-antigen/teichoic acid export membrane protein